MTNQAKKKKNHTYKGHAGVQERLKVLRECYGLSWPIIAALDEFKGIPTSTLRSIFLTGIVPKKHRHRFPGVGAIDDRNRITINNNDINSAAESVVKHMKPRSKVEAFVLPIQTKLRKRLKSHERTNCFSIRLIIAT